MARYHPDHDAGPIHSIADQWKTACLIADGSLFRPDAALWTLDNLQHFDRAFVGNPIEGNTASFLEKFKLQLQNESPETVQLASEIMFVHFLFTTSVGPQAKIEMVRTVWAWSGAILPNDHPMFAPVGLRGVANTGTAYNTLRWKEVAYLISLAVAFKRLPPDSRIQTVASAETFSEWVYGQPMDGDRMFRRMILYLLFPDSYERAATLKDKHAILSALEPSPIGTVRKVAEPELDQRLLALRERLGRETGTTEIDFYRPPLIDRWKPKASPDDDTEPSDVTEQAGEAETSGSKPSLSPFTIDDIVREGCFIERTKLNDILSMAREKCNLVLQGAPGTGKTWLARRLAYALIGERDEARVTVLQFHPSLSYEDFVRGWRPSADGKLQLVDGAFLRAAEAAKTDPTRDYVVVIEEINRGNPAQIFGELLTLLENTKRKPSEAIALAYPRHGEGPVHLPPNLFVIGTMNIADRSLALVDLALRRRFAFITLEPRLGPEWRQHCAKLGMEADTITMIEDRMTELNKAISDDRALGPAFRIGHSVVTPESPVADSAAWFEARITSEIAPLLEEYWYDRPERAADATTSLRRR